jgi:nucleotide-binding universal stress UspA family protein
MYDTILLPTDGSESMRTVFEHATDVAARRGATVHVLYVVDDRAFLTLEDDLVDDVLADLRIEGEAAIEETADALAAEDVSVETAIRKGSPADEILDYAGENGVDLIIMGSRGVDATENLLGSTSQKVVTMSDVPVLTVRLEESDGPGPAVPP